MQEQDFQTGQQELDLPIATANGKKRQSKVSKSRKSACGSTKNLRKDLHLDAKSSNLLRCIEHEPRTIENICDASGLDISDVSAGLMCLELDGCITKQPNGSYGLVMK